jgi:hypothetical protein
MELQVVDWRGNLLPLVRLAGLAVDFKDMTPLA